ncbi:1525_t:CDS:2 [Racocetra persica]|uniref:1525_t:CDS:1 n=1 Tax=Racocetra persica TaxID=160502 RepID=A0ACA9LWH8_9GLOM|nr:1525_t:CDS:2 [Racocetra persica]
MSNQKTKSININLFSIAAQSKNDSNNNIDDESSISEEIFRSHVNINDYQMICVAQTQSQVTLQSSFAIQAETDQIKVIRNICNVYFLIQHNLSTNIFESLYKLSKIQCAEDQNQFEYRTETLNIFDNNQFADDDE